MQCNIMWSNYLNNVLINLEDTTESVYYEERNAMLSTESLSIWTPQIFIVIHSPQLVIIDCTRGIPKLILLA